MSPDHPGYGPHHSLSFPTWHRIYLHVLETNLLSTAHEIAEMYPAEQRDEYRHAARMLRLPYWDWLSHAELPEIVTREVISLQTPKGEMEIFNPLFSYKFRAGSGSKNGFPEDMKVSMVHRKIVRGSETGLLMGQHHRYLCFQKQ